MQNNLQLLRAKHNLTQQELAQKLSVSRQTINAIENEKFNPSLELAFKLSELFKLSIEEIFVHKREEHEEHEFHHRKHGYG